MTTSTPLITWSIYNPFLMRFDLSGEVAVFMNLEHRVYFSFPLQEHADVSKLESVGQRGADVVRDASRVLGVSDITLQSRAIEVGLRSSASILEDGIHAALMRVLSERCDVPLCHFQHVSSPNVTLRRSVMPHQRTRRLAMPLKQHARRRR